MSELEQDDLGTESQEDNLEEIEEGEGIGAEGPTETEAGEGEESFYSPDELEALHPKDIDLERVTPEARPIVEKTIKEYKSLMADHTRRAQENAELKRSLEKPKKENRTIDDYFEDDPQGTIANIDQYITAKKREARTYRAQGDIDAAQVAMDEVDEWSDTRVRLLTNRVFKQDEIIRKEREKYRLPEYDKRKEEAEDYLLNTVGMDQVHAGKLLEDVTMVKHFSSLKAQQNAKVTAKSKVVKTSPTELGRPGSSAPARKVKVSEKELLKKAAQTGSFEDWDAVLRARKVI
jgi:hypothetical protein